MAKAPTSAAAGTLPLNSDDSNENIAADAAAMQAAEDERIAAAQLAEDAAVKAEAEAMRAEEANAAADTPLPVLFDTSETGLSGNDLILWMAERPRVIIFGGNGQSLPGIDAQPTDARAWTTTAGGLEFSGTFTVLAPESAGRAVADSVALADGPDGPVRAVSALGGPVTFSPGAEFKFGPGAFVFG